MSCKVFSNNFEHFKKQLQGTRKLANFRETSSKTATSRSFHNPIRISIFLIPVLFSNSFFSSIIDTFITPYYHSNFANVFKWKYRFLRNQLEWKFSNTVTPSSCWLQKSTRQLKNCFWRHWILLWFIHIVLSHQGWQSARMLFHDATLESIASSSRDLSVVYMYVDVLHLFENYWFKKRYHVPILGP